MLNLTKIQFFKILILYTLLALATVGYYNMKTLLAPARKRSFFCSDESLSKPFVYDTVSPEVLHILGIYFPIVIIATGEWISSVGVQPPLRSSFWKLKCVLRSIIILTLFLIGLAVERLWKGVTKIKMARLRPNFITVCNPINEYSQTCRNSANLALMDEYKCSSDIYPSWAVGTAFNSFPSGHTSLTSYSMIFLICYFYLMLQKFKHIPNSSSLVILIIQSLCTFTILFVAMSRILDYKHHWSDVCAGFIGGSIVALVVSYYLKSQLKNIEDWLKELMGHIPEDAENIQATYTNKNSNEKEKTCVMELVSE